MRKKHYKRELVQKRREEKRRYPFDENTMLKNLFRPECYSRIDRLVCNLRGYLAVDVAMPREARVLWFKADALKGQRKVVYGYLAEALLPWKDGKSPLAVKKSVFCRYMADAAHCNLGISERTVNYIVNQGLREIF